jgi:hypothetical protein
MNLRKLFEALHVDPDKGAWETKAPKYSPWGEIQRVDEIIPGIWKVSTPSHGGWYVEEKVILSDEAKKYATEKGSHGYWYEEDIKWAIPAHELFDQVKDRISASKDKLFFILSRWEPEYLQGRGIKPDEGALSSWERSHEDGKKRINKDPDLITAAWGEGSVPGYSLRVPKGQVLVHTADGKYHLISQHTYNTEEPNPDFDPKSVDVMPVGGGEGSDPVGRLLRSLGRKKTTSLKQNKIYQRDVKLS